MMYEIRASASEENSDGYQKAESRYKNQFQQGIHGRQSRTSKSNGDEDQYG